MNLQPRIAQADDFAIIYQEAFFPFGYNSDPWPQARHEWRTLLEWPTSHSLVLEDLDRPCLERIRAYALMVFVSDAFVAWARADMPPFLNASATQVLPDGSWPLLDLDQVAADNAAGRLNILLAHWGWIDDTVATEEGPQVRDQLFQRFHTRYGGYRLQEILLEVFGPVRLAMGANSGLLLRRDFADYYALHPPRPEPAVQPYLLSITRQEALQSEYSLMAGLFQNPLPRFRLSQREQELAMLAMAKLTDEQMARELSRSPGSIKSRWAGIYTKVSKVDPLLLPEGEASASRGSEKRRRLVDYLREHPEELRPFQPDRT